MSNFIAVTTIWRRSSGAQIKKKVRKKYIQNKQEKGRKTILSCTPLFTSP